MVFREKQGRLKQVRRISQIVNVLLKYGFDDIIARLELKKLAPKESITRSAKTVPGSRWERLRMAFEELGPAYIKLGQLISNRGDLFPLDLVVELEKLQMSVPPFDSKKAEAIVEQELGKPTATLFREFAEQPEAAASIAQVHKAVLFSGEEVAVKIQRPDIRNMIQLDIELMEEFAGMLQNYFPEIEKLNIIDFIKEFESAISKELDFRAEAANILRFHGKSRTIEYVHSPKVYTEYSTGKVLTMEFLYGTPVSDFRQLERSGVSSKLVSERIVKIYFKQILDFGFFHADPHPGNILIMKDNHIGFIDFGIMGIVQRTDRELITSIIIGLYVKDTRRIVRSIQKVSPTSIDNIQHFEYRLGELIEEYSHQSLNRIDVGEVARKLKFLVLEYNINVPSNFFLLLKTLSLVESIVKSLDHEINIHKILKPYGKKLIAERLNPVNFAKDIFLSALDFNSFIREIPADAEEVIKKIKEGTINIHLEHRGLEDFIETLDRVSNRISVAIILASIIIASSLVVLSKLPPLWNNIPIIGIIGFVISGLIGLLLLFSIFRKRNF